MGLTPIIDIVTVGGLIAGCIISGSMMVVEMTNPDPTLEDYREAMRQA